MITVKQILKAIGEPKLTLERIEDGYYIFVYDDIENKVWETESIMCYRLNHMDIENWISYGKSFVERMKK